MMFMHKPRKEIISTILLIQDWGYNHHHNNGHYASNGIYFTPIHINHISHDTIEIADRSPVVE